MNSGELKINFEYLSSKFPKEALSLASINERFDNEPEQVKNLRFSFLEIFANLLLSRDNTLSSEAKRQYSIAITEAESSLMRAIKGFYS
ncbi:hypothetical protein DLH72_04970 [Candidatus Gracilibacteria bacterium]|nr:MAG: hypothetical protein DLH72_04970 [Candidatus Gracilibacteria bacterium]